MTDKDNNFKIEFAPGAFDNFDGTQEELDQMIAEIQQMFEGKSKEEIEAMSKPLDDDDFEDLPDEVKEQILRSMFEDEDLSDEFKRKLQ